MKIRNKFIIFVVTISFFSTIGSLLMGFYNLNSVDNLFKSRQSEKETLFDQLHTLKSSTLLSYAYDYTYWDDMVTLAQKGNPVFAKENIDPSLTTYKANAAWVYNLDFKLAYSVNNLSNDKLKEFPLATEDLRQTFGNNLFPHFYVKIGSDIMEVAGAPIQPSSDVERKTAPQGYFLVARVWDKAYFKEFSDLLGGVVERDDADEDQSFFATDKQKGIVVFHRELIGFDGKDVVGFHAEINTPEVSSLYQITRFELYYITTIALVSIAFAVGILYLALIKPLALISKSLDQSDSKWLEKIQKSKDEFGQVARMIIKSFEQKATLEKEVAEHFRSEKEMEKHKNELERINKTMIDRELRMIELKKEIERLKTKLEEKNNG